MKKLDVNECGLAYFILILSLHYLVRCRSRNLVIYNNKLIPCNACVGSKNHRNYKITKNFVTNLALMIFILTLYVNKLK